MFLCQPGSYGVRVYSTVQRMEYKMYNHSCDQMDRKEGQDVPVVLSFDVLSQEGVGEKANLELITATGGKYDLKKGFEIYEEDYKLLRESVPDLPKWTESQVGLQKIFIFRIHKIGTLHNSKIDTWVCFHHGLKLQLTDLTKHKTCHNSCRHAFCCLKAITSTF